MILSFKKIKKKILNNEEKINELTKRVTQNEYNITDNHEKITENKKNVDKLLKESEEMKKKAKKEKEEEKLNEKVNPEIIKKYITQNHIHLNDEEIELMKKDINSINEKYKEMEINMEGINSQMQKNLNNLVNTIETKGEISITTTTQNKTSDANLFKVTMLQMEKNKKHFQEMIDQLNTTQEKIKQDIKWLNDDFLENKKNYTNLSNSVNIYLEEKKYYLTYKDIKDLTGNVDALTNKILQLSHKTELEELKNDFVMKFNKINAKLKEISEKEGKIEKNLRVRSGEEDWKAEDLNFVPMSKRITELISDLLKSEGKNIDLTKNKHFIELMKLNQQNSNELDKNMKNVLDLKSFVSTILSQKDLDKVKKDLDDFKKEFKIYKSKLLEIIHIIGAFDGNNEEEKEKEREKEREKDRERQKLNQDKVFDKKIKQSEETIKGKIDYLTEYVENLTEKVMKSEKKINSISKEVKDDMKANLRLDTYKVVEQFKLKLNSFTDKFENELKNKIDKMGLNVFENKLNSKLSIDLKDKLNKNDLKKNNFLINKKIDTLENKISKTLVDTIIDLQMDDVPLLVKKNQKNVELCASCNRPLNETSMSNRTLEQTQLSTTPNFMVTPKNKLKNISSLKKLPMI